MTQTNPSGASSAGGAEHPAADLPSGSILSPGTDPQVATRPWFHEALRARRRDSRELTELLTGRPMYPDPSQLYAVAPSRGSFDQADQAGEVSERP